MVTHDVLESSVGLFLIQCLLIIILSRVVTYIFSKVQQPAVIAEIISGILLGPTAFGKIPGFTQHIFPAPSLVTLGVFAQIGLIFFMFIIGLELDPTLFRSQIRNSLIISAASILLPFGLGIAASVFLADIQGTEWTYSLGIFIGVALAITAFPVLARILTSKKLLATPIGSLSIACAAINDICGWVLLGLSVSLAGSSNSLDTLWTLLASIGFVAIMILVVRPLLLMAVSKVWHVNPQAGHPPSPSHLIMSVSVILLFISSWCTEIIGIHAMFGAFTLGAITPKLGGFNQAITEKIEDLIQVFLLPLYFVISGLRTDLTTLNTGKPWLGVLVVILCACVGKIVGAGLTARILRKSTRDSIAIGILMNTRGLVELIVLNLGLDFGIIKTQVFGIMVLMAVFTTILTSPLITLVTKKDKKTVRKDEFVVVFCTPTLHIGPSLVDLGYTIGNKYTISTLTRRKLKKIYLLSIAEVNERPSDFIGQIRKDISKSTFSHLIQQGTAMRMKVAFNSIVSDNDHLGKEVLQFSENKCASMLILGEDSHHRGVISGDITWYMIKNSISHVGVFTDKSGTRGTYNRFKRILCAHLGGKNPNDYETLELINRMAETDGIQITVIVFDNELFNKHKNMSKDEKPVNLPLKSPDEGVDKDKLNATNGSITESSDTNLSKTNTLFDTAKIQQFTSHLESVVNGKNSKKFSVIYRPRRHRQKFLLEQCATFDLLVVPFEVKKPSSQASPFNGFPGIDLMKKSLSMVHLPGRKLSESVHHRQLDEEMASGRGSSSTTLNSEMHAISDNVHNELGDMNNNNGHIRSELSDSTDSQESDEKRSDPYWHRCPISTLVVYHKDSIPPHPNDLLEEEKQRQQQQLDNTNDNFCNDEDVKQVDPSIPQININNSTLIPSPDVDNNNNNFNNNNTQPNDEPQYPPVTLHDINIISPPPQHLQDQNDSNNNNNNITHSQSGKEHTE